MIEDKLGQALGVANTDIVTAIDNAVAVIDESKSHIETDYELARNNLTQIMTTGMAALKELSEISTASQHPRSFEVLTSLIAVLGDTNEKLMSLQKDLKELENHSPSRININAANAVFCGTASELLEITKQRKLQKE